jgi:hypothetical protein
MSLLYRLFPAIMAAIVLFSIIGTVIVYQKYSNKKNNCNEIRSENASN